MHAVHLIEEGRVLLGLFLNVLDGVVQPGAVQQLAVLADQKADDIGQAGIGQGPGRAGGLPQGRVQAAAGMVDGHFFQDLGQLGVVGIGLLLGQAGLGAVGVARKAQAAAHKHLVPDVRVLVGNGPAMGVVVHAHVMALGAGAGQLGPGKSRGIGVEHQGQAVFLRDLHIIPESGLQPPPALPAVVQARQLEGLGRIPMGEVPLDPLAHRTLQQGDGALAEVFDKSLPALFHRH